MMVATLKREEVVNCLDRLCVVAPKPDRRPTGEGLHRVADACAPGGHRCRTRHRLCVHEPRQPKVPIRELGRDLLHVPPDLGSSRAVIGVALQLDSAAVGQGLEDVARGVLIDTHGNASTRLDPGKGGVLGGLGLPDGGAVVAWGTGKSDEHHEIHSLHGGPVASSSLQTIMKVTTGIPTTKAKVFQNPAVGFPRRTESTSERGILSLQLSQSTGRWKGMPKR
jgi:hypothetical protein